ncbi:hypothetical protein SALBM311S_00400 [Streptomyces alboniger]
MRATRTDTQGDGMRGWRSRSRSSNRSRSEGRGRELAALIGSLAVTLALMMWGASSASAGGPTSVLVTSPASGEADALYYSDNGYRELQQLLGAAGRGTRDQPPEAELTRDHQINVTWLAHDISPWRLDRVFPAESGAGAVWIHTAANLPDTPNGYWHRADHPTRLRALLSKLGVMGKVSGEGYTGIFPAPWQSETPPAADPDTETAELGTGAPVASDDTHWWTVGGAWSTVAGLGVGFLTGVGGALLIRRAAARPGAGPPREEPRQELIDL